LLPNKSALRRSSRRLSPNLRRRKMRILSWSALVGYSLMMMSTMGPMEEGGLSEYLVIVWLARYYCDL
jgi:hypothetical protein